MNPWIQHWSVERFKRNTAFIYILVWVVLGTIHFFILNLGYKILPLPSFLDSLIYNGLFAIFGVGLWYMVRFSNLQSRSITELAIYHLSGTAVTVLAWMGLGYLVLSNVMQDDRYYHGFLDKTQTIRAITGVLFYAVMVSAYYLVINIRELKEKNERENRLTALLKETELNLLRSQIRPHFLFNSLNSISSLTLSDPEKAREMVVKLSEFMRYSLGSQDAKMSTLEKEIYHADLYLDIEKVRFGDRLVVEKKVDPASLSWNVPSMILQPLLENAVKYGVYEAGDPVTIRLDTRIEQSLLIIRIGNDYEDGGKVHRGTGTGLKNIQARLGNLYGSNDLFKVKDEDHYFEVELKIPPDVR